MNFMKRDGVVGRPRKDNARSIRNTTRFSEREINMLTIISNETGKTYSDIVREAVRYLYYSNYFDPDDDQ